MRSSVRSLLLALTLVVGACTGAVPASPSQVPPVPSSSAAPAATIAAAPLTIHDDAGRVVTFETTPQRIVTAAPSATELAFALGLGDEVVAVDKYSNYPPQAASKPSIGNYIDPDLEAIVGANPDLVLVTDVDLAKLVPALEARHIPTVVLSAKSIDGVFADLELLGQITGRRAQAETLVDQLRARVARVEQAVAGATLVRTFYEIDPTLYTAGPGTFIDDVIRRAGGVNIAAGATTAYPQLSQEQIVNADPEVIILADGNAGVSPAVVRSRQGWSQVSAVVSNRIFAIDPDIAERPGPRIVDALEQVAHFLHPDRVP
jgi:iron complex transport system substrate-binding protein